MIPLLTTRAHEALLTARRAAVASLECSLDLERSHAVVYPGETRWRWGEQEFPYLEACKERTIYYWTGSAFEPVARFGTSLIKLIATDWGPPTFEIDGIKMLPTATVSPYEDAGRKVELIRPGGKVILDTCGGLGYFAARCVEGGAARVLSFEKNPDVIWLRELNPWSPCTDNKLSLAQADVSQEITTMANESVDAILHDPPRFGIAGELYSQVFYDQLARVLKRRGRMFHYTGTPNKVSRGRDLPSEVAGRLRNSGFTTEMWGDGVVAVKK